MVGDDNLQKVAGMCEKGLTGREGGLITLGMSTRATGRYGGELMNYPSVTRIKSRLGVTLAVARAIRHALDCDSAIVNSHPVVIADFRARGIVSEPSEVSTRFMPLQERRLLIVNNLLNGHGVERAAGVDYVNMGDTYAQTVLWDRRTARYAVMDWGYFAERRADGEA
jgi:hypothetical protein